jgi:putative phosphoesterase
MRLAIISDIHGNLVALEAVLADLRARSPDVTVNLGDCVTSPLWPRETMELLAALNLPTVRGNHDRWIAEMPADHVTPSVSYTHGALSPAQRAALGALPASLEIDGILAVHGTPDSDMDYLLEDAVDGRLALARSDVLARRLSTRSAPLVLCGHSHHQHMAFAAGNRLVLNPGSVGCPRYADNRDPFVAEAGSPWAHFAVATRRALHWNIELLALEYDRTSVVQRARSVQRDDWVTGYEKGVAAL